MTATAKKSPKVLATTDTPIGQFWLVVDDDLVVASGFGKCEAKPDSKVDHSHKYILAVKRYFEGDIGALKQIKYCQQSSPFYSKVYKHMSEISPGQTKTYKDLATKAGNSRAVRAVGSACRRNTVPLIIPCHRVVKTDGSLGQYLFGVKVKKWLLDHEVAHTGSGRN